MKTMLSVFAVMFALFFAITPTPALAQQATDEMRVAQESASPPSTEVKPPAIPERSYWIGEVNYSGYIIKVEFDLVRQNNEVTGKHHFANPYRSVSSLNVTGTMEGEKGNVLKLKIPGLAFGALDVVVDTTGRKMTGTYVGETGTPLPIEAQRLK